MGGEGGGGSGGGGDGDGGGGDGTGEGCGGGGEGEGGAGEGCGCGGTPGWLPAGGLTSAPSAALYSENALEKLAITGCTWP